MVIVSTLLHILQRHTTFSNWKHQYGACSSLHLNFLHISTRPLEYSFLLPWLCCSPVLSRKYRVKLLHSAHISLTSFIIHQPVGLMGDLLIFSCLQFDQSICLDMPFPWYKNRVTWVTKKCKEGEVGIWEMLIFHSQVFFIAVNILWLHISHGVMV